VASAHVRIKYPRFFAQVFSRHRLPMPRLSMVERVGNWPYRAPPQGSGSKGHPMEVDQSRARRFPPLKPSPLWNSCIPSRDPDLLYRLLHCPVRDRLPAVPAQRWGAVNRMRLEGFLSFSFVLGSRPTLRSSLRPDGEPCSPQWLEQKAHPEPSQASVPP